MVNRFVILPYGPEILNYFLNHLNSRYSSSTAQVLDKSRKIRWAGCVARMEVKRTAYSSSVGRPEGKR
jgi:hypothetical protein